MARFGSLGTQYFDDSGDPLVNGLIYFYVSGTVDTPITTYADIGESVPNANPVQLDADGRQPDVFFSGLAKAVLKTSAGVIIDTKDPVGDTVTGTAFALWDSELSYSEGDLVSTSSGIYYRSLTDSNLGNDPAISPSDWERAIDGFLDQQTTIPEGQMAVGSATSGLTALDTKTKGTIAVGNGTTTTTLAAGTNTYVLTADSAEAKGIKWAAVPDTARDLQTFTSSGTWTKPAGAQFVLVEAWGGGGGGANNTASSTAESGGSGGEYVYKLFAASTLGATETVTIGAGGAGTANGATADGSAGGTTTFGSLLSAIGGNPGKTGAGTIYITIPRSTATTSAISGSPYGVLITPQAGPGSTAAGGKTIYGGGGGGGSDTGGSTGGDSEFGGDGGGGNNTLNTAAANGSAPAGGGGGSGNNGGGGTGGRGEVRVWTW